MARKDVHTLPSKADASMYAQKRKKIERVPFDQAMRFCDQLDLSKLYPLFLLSVLLLSFN